MIKINACVYSNLSSFYRDDGYDLVLRFITLVSKSLYISNKTKIFLFLESNISNKTFSIENKQGTDKKKLTSFSY